MCSNECQGSPKGCKKGKSGGMHIYAYYSNMRGNKGCGDEYTFRKGGKAMVVHPNKDYTIRLVVKLNSASKALLSFSVFSLPAMRRQARTSMAKDVLCILLPRLLFDVCGYMQRRPTVP